MLRNVASQKYRVYAWTATTGLPKTGDAANITAYLTKDDGTPAAITDTNPTEASATNEPGYYDFDVTQTESNAAKLSLSPKSTTTDIVVVACPPVVYTRPQYYSLLAIDSAGAIAGLVAAVCNKIADHVRRRTQANVEASSDGDTLDLLSHYGVIQQTQESSISGGVMTVKKTDGTTTLGTRAVTTNAAAEPITGVS